MTHNQGVWHNPGFRHGRVWQKLEFLSHEQDFLKILDSVAVGTPVTRRPPHRDHLFGDQGLVLRGSTSYFAKSELMMALSIETVKETLERDLP